MTMILKSAVAAATVAMLAGCAATSPSPSPAPTADTAESIALSVGPCFGFCPVYDTKIASDGTISFTGTRHTAVLGPRERRASPQTYSKLEADLAPFRPATGSTAEIACSAEISDMATYTITWTGRDGQQTIATHRAGCREGAGHDLDMLLRVLPERLGIEAWMKQTTRPGVSRG